MAVGITHTTESTVAIDKARIISDGSDHATVTVTLKDSAGTVVKGNTVVLEAIANGAGVDIPAASGVSDSGGAVTFHPITADETHALTGKVVFRATDMTDEKVLDDTVELSTSPLADAAESTCVADVAEVSANNTALATITVTIKNAAGLPCPGHTVTLTANPSSGCTIATSPAVTDENGQAVFTAKSNIAPATPTLFTAVDTTDTVTVTQTASVTFLSSMTVNKASLSFTAIKSNPNKMGSESQSLTITCIPTTTGITVASVGGAAWLSVASPQASGVAFNVTVNRDTLCKAESVADGVYNETVRISKTGYTTVDVPVTVMVHRN